MSSKYDVIVIGGGHNGLVHAAYLASAGKKVLVLERRHVLGGAAVTEEVFPGFKFSVCSYVVSLLRPEIIRDLDLPRHGLEILPLDGTFTPMLERRLPLARQRPRQDAARDRPPLEARRRGLRRVRQGDGRHGPLRQADPRHDAARPDQAATARACRTCCSSASASRSSRAEDKYNQVQLMTMSAVDFLDQWFETDVLKATMSASGIIGTFLGVRSPGTAYVLLHHYMGEIDGAFRSWGFARGGTGAISNAIADAAREAGVEIRTKAPIAQIKVNGGRADGRRARERRRDRRRRRLLERRPAADLHEDDRREGAARTTSSRTSSATSSAAPRARSTSRSTRCRTSSRCRAPARTCAARSRSRPSVEYMERAYDDAKYGHFSRRPYIDMVIPTLTDPSVAPPGQARHVVLRPVRAVQAEGERLGQEARGLRRHRRRHDRRARAEHQEHHPAPPGRHAARPRARVGPVRGQHLPGRADRSSSSSSCGRRRAGRSTGRRSGTSTCADRRRIRAAASWAPTARTPPRSSSRTGSAGRSEDAHGREERRRHRRRRPQRPRRGVLPREGGAASRSSSSGAASSAASR